MSETPSSTFAAVSAAVNALVDDVFGSARTIAESLRTLWDRIEGEGGQPGSSDLMALRDVVTGELRRKGHLFNGAGVVVALGVLADNPRFLEWWRSSANSGRDARRLNVDLNPSSDYFYDYTEMDWFTVPRDEATSWVSGPYLDYTGVDLYVCTFAVPVTSARGVFLGIAGVDVPLSRIEDALLPTFTAAPTPLALANSQGRVVVANHADHVTGSKIRNSASSPVATLPNTPWSLILLGEDG